MADERIGLAAAAAGVDASTVQFARNLATMMDGARSQLLAQGWSEQDANRLLAVAIIQAQSTGRPIADVIDRFLDEAARDPEGVRRGLARR